MGDAVLADGALLHEDVGGAGGWGGGEGGGAVADDFYRQEELVAAAGDGGDVVVLAGALFEGGRLRPMGSRQNSPNSSG